MNFQNIILSDCNQLKQDWKCHKLRLWDFYELEKLGKKKKPFLSFIQIFMDNHTVEETLEVLRISGVCFNPYKPSSADIFNDAMPLVEEKYPENLKQIQDFRNIVNSLRTIFHDFSEVRESRGVHKIPARKRQVSFIISLEIWLGSSIEYINGHTLHRIKEVYPFVTTLFDFEKSRIVPAKRKMDQLMSIVDSISENASSVLKHLQYENGSIGKLEHLSMDQIRLSREHIELFDMFSSLLNLEQKWRYSGAEITEQDNNYQVQLHNEPFLKAQESSKVRFKSQRNKWMADFTLAKINRPIDPLAKQLAPAQYLSEEEAFFSIAIGEFLLTHDLNVQCLNVSLAEWIRAYTVIQLEAKKELEERFTKRSVQPMSLKNWTIYKDRSYWKNLFVERGISSSSSDVIIEKLTFTKDSRDLLDCPFIEHNDVLFVIPSIASIIDPSMSLVSLLVNNEIDVSFKGKGLEEDVLRKLNEKGIRAKGLKQTVKDDTYECDAAFKLDNNLILMEIKAFGQPSSFRDYYSLLLKLYGPQQRIGRKSNERSSTEQLGRIASYFENNMNYVNKELNLPMDWVPENIYKIVLTTAMIGESLFIDNTYIVDHSSFIRFLDRNAPAFSIKNVHFRPRMSDFEGNINTQKLLNVIKNPPQVVLGNVRTRLKHTRLSLMRKTVDYPFFDDALGDFFKLDDKILKVLGIDEDQLNQLLEKQ